MDMTNEWAQGLRCLEANRRMILRSWTALSNLASLQRIVGFAGEFQTGFKNSELLGILRGRESGHQLSRSGRITLSQALRSMPFEQTQLQPLSHSLSEVTVLGVV